MISDVREEESETGRTKILQRLTKEKRPIKRYLWMGKR